MSTDPRSIESPGPGTPDADIAAWLDGGVAAELERGTGVTERVRAELDATMGRRTRPSMWSAGLVRPVAAAAVLTVVAGTAAWYVIGTGSPPAGEPSRTASAGPTAPVDSASPGADPSDVGTSGPAGPDRAEAANDTSTMTGRLTAALSRSLEAAGTPVREETAAFRTVGSDVGRLVTRTLATNLRRLAAGPDDTPPVMDPDPGVESLRPEARVPSRSAGHPAA